MFYYPSRRISLCSFFFDLFWRQISHREMTFALRADEVKRSLNYFENRLSLLSAILAISWYPHCLARIRAESKPRFCTLQFLLHTGNLGWSLFGSRKHFGPHLRSILLRLDTFFGGFHFGNAPNAIGGRVCPFVK